ncbi:MAG: hypothetical protein SGI73_18260 [Chloroflexota bacterium]|nr:hypothetical protein [Chloroflexota bacterium]
MTQPNTPPSRVLPTDFLPRLIRLLAPKVRVVASREALVDEAYGVTAPALRDQIDTNGAARDVATHIVQTALDFGCLTDGRHALIPLMEALKSRSGTEQGDELDALIDAVQPLCDDTARAAELAYLLRVSAQIGAGATDQRTPPRAILLGEPALTTAALAKSARRLLAAANGDAAAPLPVVLRLSEWKDQRSTLKSLVRAELGVTDARMDTLLRRGRIALLLLDLDALPNKARIQTIRDFLDDHAALSIIVTCRAGVSAADFELELEKIIIR